MIDEPPAPRTPIEQVEDSASTNLPTVERADGSLLIDLMPLAEPPTQCVTEEPDPLNPEIIVCRETAPSPRLGADNGPTADAVLFGSAVPRARIRLSDNAELEANAADAGVGGWNGQGGEVRLKIDF